MAIVAIADEEFKKSLKAASCGKGAQTLFTGKPVNKKPRIGFLFTGQGTQYEGMGKAMYNADPQFKDHIEQCSKLLDPHFDFPLESLLWGTHKALLAKTRYIQPALYVLQTGILKYLNRCGITAEAVIGHSIGEFAAAYAAGVFTLEQGLELITARGALMGDHCPDGAMRVVFDVPERVQAFVDANSSKISIAAFNGPRNTVVSGDPEILDQLAVKLTEQRVKTRRLEVSHGFHSVQMTPMLAPFAEVVSKVRLKTPCLSFFSTVTGRQESKKLTQTNYWVSHVRKTVDFKTAIREMTNSGVDVLLEVGPGATLTILGQICVDAPQALWLNSQIPNREWEIMLQTIAQLYVRGTDIDWKGFDAPYQRRCVPLPVYQFKPKRFWPRFSISVDISDDRVDVKVLNDI